MQSNVPPNVLATPPPLPMQQPAPQQMPGQQPPQPLATVIQQNTPNTPMPQGIPHGLTEDELLAVLEVRKRSAIARQCSHSPPRPGKSNREQRTFDTPDAKRRESNKHMGMSPNSSMRGRSSPPRLGAAEAAVIMDSVRAQNDFLKTFTQQYAMTRQGVPVTLDHVPSGT
eukprot:8453212-Alexandrium_andersonii.AAC.1